MTTEREEAIRRAVPYVQSFCERRGWNLRRWEAESLAGYVLRAAGERNEVVVDDFAAHCEGYGLEWIDAASVGPSKVNQEGQR